MSKEPENQNPETTNSQPGQRPEPRTSHGQNTDQTRILNMSVFQLCFIRGSLLAKIYNLCGSQNFTAICDYL
jgi:hypothetical protein